LELDESNLEVVAGHYEYCVLFSVLHWFENPDLMLGKLSGMTKWLFFEMPELDDPVAWNQGLLERIRIQFGSIAHYLTALTGMTIVTSKIVSSHTPPFRTVYVLKTREDAASAACSRSGNVAEMKAAEPVRLTW
jgi:hypothetical protein